MGSRCGSAEEWWKINDKTPKDPGIAPQPGNLKKTF
jgi:hypothetical protein